LKTKSASLEVSGCCHIRLNQPDVAQRYYEQRLSLAQDREDTVTIGVTMGDLGNTHALLGQYRVALDCFRRARAYFAEQEGAINALAYTDAGIVKAAQSIGDELAEYVSRSIAERLLIISDEGAKKQLQDGEYPGDLKQDVLCGLLALADDLPQTIPLISHISFHKPPCISTKDVLSLVGEFTRHTYDKDSPNPRDLFEAARYIAQIRRACEPMHCWRESAKASLALCSRERGARSLSLVPEILCRRTHDAQTSSGPLG